jgi:hypothetical protein
MKSFLLIVLAFALGVGATIFWMTRPPGSPMEMPALRAQIEEAATRNFPVPDLELKRVEVTVPAKKVEAAVAHVVSLAEASGGTAMQGLDRGADKVVLAAVPKRWLADFTKAVAAFPDGKVPRDGNPPEVELVDCEVVIHPAAP